MEVVNNIEQHAKTDDPFFVCGQYYPKERSLNFSIVDLGRGFLPAIQEKTNNAIIKDSDAIMWSLKKGTTTRKDAPGGLGLYNLQNYCTKNNSILQIITGIAYWTSERSILDKNVFRQPVVGSMINLLFSEK